MAFAPVTPLRLTSLIARPFPTPTTTRLKPAVSTRAVTRAQLIGVPDHLRSNNLEPSAHEVLLAELRFTDPARLPALIENSMQALNEDFYRYINSKIADSSDLEERETLGSLRDAITDIMKQMLDAAAVDVPASDMDQPLDAEAQSAADALRSYDEFIDSLVLSFKKATSEEERQFAVKAAVNLNYHRIDLAMLERLSERIVSAGEESPVFARVRDVISDAMNERVTNAMESVKAVLSAGSMIAMKKQVNALASQGKLDDAFTLLLQANLDQATKAGATQAIDIISGILAFATEVKDMGAEPEVRLIRTLLRTEDEETRMDLLTDHLESGAPVALADGSSSSGTKIDGKKFVDALRKLIEEFGNVDEKFILKLSKIGEESEAVARKVFDMEGKDIEDYQNEAFHKRTVSVWDLEEYEHGETMEGRSAAWEGQLGSIPEQMGFDQDGKLSV